MVKALKTFLLALTVSVACADEQIIGPFGGLNTTDNPAIIATNQAQDMLNVDISPGGKSAKKREGMALDTTFTYSTSVVHGAYKFFDSSGNEIRLWGQDAGLYASVAGASYVRVATGTVGATWQCTDNLGFAYCVTSARDSPVKTAGTTGTTSYQVGIPSGTIIASTPERLLVAGTATNPQRLHYSAASNFTDFTVGSTAASASYEDISAPGSAITHLAYRYGRWLWWKDQSFGFLVGTDQTNLQLITVSNTVGTFDNTDVYDDPFTWFRGTDAHFYTYNGSNLERKSRDISPTVTSANRRKANSWTQNTQAEFGAGAVTYNGPSLALSTAIAAGSVYPSSISITDTSSVDFGSATIFGLGIDTFTVSGAVTLRTFLNDTFSNLNNWTSIVGASFPGTMVASGGIATCTNPMTEICQAISTTTVSASFMLQMAPKVGTAAIWAVNASRQGYGMVVNPNGSVSSIYKTTDYGNTAGWSVIIGSVPPTGSNFTLIRDSETTSIKLFLDGVMLSSATDTTYSSFTHVVIQTVGLGAGVGLDNVYNVAGKAFFSSRAFDTAFSTPVYGSFTANSTSTGTYAYAVRCSSNAVGSYTADTTITSGSNITGCSHKRYLIYSATMTAPGNTATLLPQFTDASMFAASTGTFYSAVNNASALTAWNTLGMTDITNGNSSISYFSRASTNSFTVLSSTPSWVAQTKNATVAASTGTYFQLRADFAITAATETPHLDDFTFNWFEGNAADKMYGTYWDYAILFAVSLGTTTTSNNRVLRYDLINNIWTPYSIASNGFLTYNNNLYIGDSTVGKTYRFGGVYSDNNAAINSYWKSKEFFGASPFQNEDLKTMSWYCKTSSGTTLSVTYQVNESTETTYTVNLYDPKANIIRYNRNLPTSTTANVFNVKFGDNSTNNPWECYAGQVTYVPSPWVVYP